MQGGPNVGSAVYDRTSGTKDGPQACGTVLGLLPFTVSLKAIVGKGRLTHCTVSFKSIVSSFKLIAGRTITAKVKVSE